MRLDHFLLQKYPQYSRSLLQKLIKNGHVTVNGAPETTVKQLVADKDVVELDTSILSPSENSLSLEVVYEDDNCVVVYKPLGVLTHSKGAYNPEPTVASWLRGRQGFNFPADNDRAGIVHRLDRATSGIMICAKNKQTLGHLQKQFQLRKAKKTYVARVVGALDQPEALIDLPIERNPKKPQTFRIGGNGKAAQTQYKVLKEYENSTLLELKPITGRTHQLRVHMSYINHPIIGDPLYGGPESDRLYLHATALEITLPGGDRKTFTVDVPQAFSGDTL